MSENPPNKDSSEKDLPVNPFAEGDPADLSAAEDDFTETPGLGERIAPERPRRVMRDESGRIIGVNPPSKPSVSPTSVEANKPAPVPAKPAAAAKPAEVSKPEVPAAKEKPLEVPAAEVKPAEVKPTEKVASTQTEEAPKAAPARPVTIQKSPSAPEAPKPAEAPKVEKTSPAAPADAPLSPFDAPVAEAPPPPKNQKFREAGSATEANKPEGDAPKAAPKVAKFAQAAPVIRPAAGGAAASSPRAPARKAPVEQVGIAGVVVDAIAAALAVAFTVLIIQQYFS